MRAYSSPLPPDKASRAARWEGLGGALEEEEEGRSLTLFFTDWLLSVSSMSRSKWNTCGLRIPRTPCRGRRRVPKQSAQEDALVNSSPLVMAL